MSLSIQGNFLFLFNRTLSNEDVQRAINSSSKEEAIHVGIWEKIKDWFCGTNTSEALEKIYELTHSNDEFDTETILKKVTAFYQLKEMVYPVYQDRFQASITSNEGGAYTFSFSIKDVMDECALVYGNTEKDIYSLKERELTNNSEFLDNNTVIREGLDVALNQVKYDDKENKLDGVALANQSRVNLHLLDEETKQEMAVNQRFAQKWIALQIKCFDYYAAQRSSLDSIDGLDITSVIGTEKKWIFHFAQSINEIKRNTQENLAKEFNDEIKKLNDLNIYNYPDKLDNEPIYSEPYKNNEPIYEGIQFNSSEISSKKYYKGSINGDIYAKVDKKILINQNYSKK
uniref:Secreted effector protein sopD2 n=1 Tax=Arsenophonus endosymbiont of Trialeurodes vaporariorum TaxID=235567 RepID=A0A3B0MJQ1_9GAMM